MKKITVLLLFVTSVCQAQIRLSDQAEISVLTLGPWEEEIFTAFGHSAFRVHDPVQGIDAAYNYGVFNFNGLQFYLNFARGHNVYKLGVMDYRRFEYDYISDNRYIHQQTLNLRPDQRQRLFDFLQWNARPENREYLYDYFYDNCATKIPEVVLKVFGDTVRFDGSYVTTDYTIRELTDLYLKEQPWGDLGIDIGLGLPMDKKATPYEYMFLPDFVESGFAHASIVQEGRREPLVESTHVTYASTPEEYPPHYFHPFIVFSVFLLVAGLFSYRDLKKQKLSVPFDAVLFGVTGFLGICLALLWTATNHHAAAKNLNLLWALPTHFVAVFFLRKQHGWIEKYFLGVAVLCGLLVITWPLVPQKLNYSLIPLVIALGIRSYTEFRIRKLAL